MDGREPGRGQARQRRGGFGDTGLLAVGAGGLPEAQPVSVASEAELLSELERVVTQLAPAVEWTQRVDALLRLEGLVKGGAAGFAGFSELLLGLRDALTAQMLERRSAVSRQACHAVATLAAACGTTFEPLAVHLLPVIFKTLAMGINIVTEAAEVCAHAMLAHCPSHRLLPKLCATVCGDKNGRLRQSAADFLLRALSSWEPADVERQQEAVERAVLAAAQDAQVETRAAGRSMYAAYAHAWPAQAHAMLGRLGRDRQLQEKLCQAAEEYVPGMLPEGLDVSQPISRRSSLGNSGAATPRGGLPRTSSFPTAAASHQPGGGAVRLAPVVPKLALYTLGSAADSSRSSPSRPSSARTAGPAAAPSLAQPVAWQQPAAASWRESQPAAASSRENQPDNRGAAVQATPRSMFPKTRARREAAAVAADSAEAEPEAGRQAPAAAARERPAPRRSVGGAALRMSVASFRRQQEPGEAGEAALSQAAGPAAAHETLRAPLPPLQLPLIAESPPPQQQQQRQQPEDLAPRAMTARRLGILERQPSNIPEDSEVSILSSGWEEAACPAASLAPLLAGLGKPGVGWADKVALFQSVQAAMQQSGSSHSVAADVASNADRLMAALLEASSDAHFKVATAALAALAAGLASPCTRRLFEPQLDRVMTALFARVVDPKEQIRQLVAASLSIILSHHSGDAVVAALGRSLHANRAPKVKCAVMHFFAAAVTAPAPGSAPAQEEGEEEGLQPQAAAVALPPLPLQQLTGSGLGSLLRGVLQLATDKNPDIRRAAAEAVAAAYHAGEAQLVLGIVQGLPPADCLAVQRAIAPAIQQRGGGAAPASAAAPPPAQGTRSAAVAPSTQSGSLTSRRQSGEGLRQLAAQQQQQPRPESGSLTARSRQSSQAGSPAPVGQQQAAAPTAQLTPQPPSPFIWRGPSASPLGAAAQPGDGPTAEQQPAVLATVAAGAGAEGATAGLASRAGPHLAAGTDEACAELAPFDDVMAGQLQRLLAQLEQGPTSEALQGLSRLAHVLPAAAWPACCDQVVAALCAALDSSSAVVRDAGLMLTRDLSAAALPSLFLPALPALLPRLLACAAEQQEREVAVAADVALEQLLQRAPPQSCLGLLAPRLPAGGATLSADRQQGAELHAAIRSLRRVVVRMQPAGLGAHLQPVLMPGLCSAFRSPLADVRKATVDCLVGIWQVVGDAIQPHLQSLSASQSKLLAIYCDRARSGQTA